MTQNNTPNTGAGKKKNTGLWIALAALAVVVALLCVFVLPAVLKNAKKTQAFQKMENGEYAEAATLFSQLSDEDTALYYEYCTGMAKLENAEYEGALELLRQAKRVENAAEMIPECYYGMGIQAIEKEDYENAILCFKDANTIKDAAEKIQQCYYLRGKQLMDSDCSAAKNYFQMAGNYQDAAQMMTACDFLTVEEMYKAGKLNAAKAAYQRLPEDFSYKGISVKDRLNVLNSNPIFLKICGPYFSSRFYAETREVMKGSGAWESQYLDDPHGYLEVFCLPNADGTFTIRGRVDFYKFTYYNSGTTLPFSESVEFQIPHISSVPSSTTIAKDTTLLYSGGVFKLVYSAKEDYRSYYDQFRTDVTFGKTNEEF